MHTSAQPCNKAVDALHEGEASLLVACGCNGKSIEKSPFAQAKNKEKEQALTKIMFISVAV